MGPTRRLVVDQDDQSSLVWAVGTPTIIGGRAHLRELGGSRGAEPGKSFTKRRAGWGREAEKRERAEQQQPSRTGAKKRERPEQQQPSRTGEEKRERAEQQQPSRTGENERWEP